MRRFAALYICMQTLEGVEMVFESPSSPKAILLLFHGCQHSSTDWWPKSAGCTACTGVVRAAINHVVCALGLASKTSYIPGCKIVKHAPCVRTYLLACFVALDFLPSTRHMIACILLSRNNRQYYQMSHRASCLRPVGVGSILC